MDVSYQTQHLSRRFFLLMAVLFMIQAGFGLLLSAQHMDPTLLQGTLNFNVARAEHVNLGVLWVISGFIGTILFVGPLLAGRELASPWLIKVLFVALIGVSVWNALTLPLAQSGTGGWWLGQPWLQEGLEYLEAGRVTDILILVGFLILTFVVLRSFPPRRTWNEIHWGLAIGVSALFFLWLFGMFFVPRVDLQEYFRWFVVHYWVEGVWEIIHISLIGFLLVRMFGADMRSVGFAVFWGVSMVWLSGLLGNAHHYFWIGTPDFWQFWGSLFSALEPLPMLFCFWHVYLDAHHNDRPLQNAPAFYFILGSVVLEHVGAGILGFTMTFALTNVWSHGTWVTPGHAHLALFGTFGMLGIAGAYFALPALRKVPHFDQRLGRLSFALLFSGILGMGIAFSLGGTVQVFAMRILGSDWYGGEVFAAMGVYKVLLAVSGFVLIIGAFICTYDLFTLGARLREPGERVDTSPALTSAGEVAAVGEAHAAAVAPASTQAPQGQTRVGPFARPLSRFEVVVWMLGFWIFGFLITFGLLSFNLTSVRLGNPTIPYVLSGVGYPGLFLATLLFVVRFIMSMEARAKTSKTA